ncbi:MAG: glycosyltransferase family 4 protein, partial [Gemmatimonadota bacterium]
AEEVEATLIVCGRNGHATSELKRIHAETGLGDRVRFLGNRDDVPEILAAADIFAFPSVYEGLGGAVIEAMALGLPVVCSDIPALREVVEQERNARLVPSMDPRAMARALRTILEEPTMADRMGRRSRRIFLERFTLERSAQRMIDLYREVSGHGRGKDVPVAIPLS